MREEYNFGESVANPYTKKPYKQITINLDVDVVDYFKASAVETGIPYQRLINLYLAQCVAEGKKLVFA